MTLVAYSDVQLHWKFNETSGTTAADSSGHSRDGTVTTSGGWSTGGKHDGWLLIDGLAGGNYVSETGYIPTMPFSIELDFLASTLSTTQIFFWLGKDGAAGWDAFYLQLLTDGRIGAVSVASTVFTAATTTMVAGINSWNKVIAVFESTTSRRISLNGGAFVSDTTSNAPSGVDKLYLARHGVAGGGSFTNLAGYDNFKLYNKALDATDVAFLWNDSLGRDTNFTPHTPVTFYISEAGSDGNDGLSTGAPKATWASVKASGSYDSGDTVLFNGGDEFTETMLVEKRTNFGSYGVGQAKLIPEDENDYHVEFLNCPASVNNLELAGLNAEDITTSQGILVTNTLGGTIKLSGVSITECLIHGYFAGVTVSGDGGTTSGYDGVTITDNVVHDCRHCGIGTASDILSVAARLTNVLIEYNDIYDIWGHSAGISGIPLIMGFMSGANVGNGGNTDNATVICRYNSLHDSGTEATNTGGGPGGLVVYFSEGCWIYGNEAYNIKEANPGGDGFGLDLDISTSNSMVEFNYTHDNDNAGLATFGCLDNNVFRFNDCINDGIQDINYGAMRISGYTGSGLQIYNNTLIPETTVAGGCLIYGNTGSAGIYNNIFSCESGQYCIIVSTSPTLEIEGNLYDSDGVCLVNWNGSIKSSLADFRTDTGKENHGSVARGIEGTPDFHDRTNHATLGDPTAIPSNKSRQLLTGSDGLGAGLDLNSLFSITMPDTDILGGTLPGSGYSVGAFDAEFTEPTGPPPDPNIHGGFDNPTGGFQNA